MWENAVTNKTNRQFNIDTLCSLYQGCINRPRIGEDFSSETSLPSFPHIGNVGITRKTMESTAELILCGS